MTPLPLQFTDAYLRLAAGLTVSGLVVAVLALTVPHAIHPSAEASAQEASLRSHAVFTFVAAFVSPLCCLLIAKRNLARPAFVSMGLLWVTYALYGLFDMYTDAQTVHATDLPVIIFGFGGAVLCSLPYINPPTPAD